MLDGSKERVIYEHHFSVAVSECPSLVSDENTGRPTCRYRGDGGEGARLGAVFFTYENKKRDQVKPTVDRVVLKIASGVG
jgi:hypothetical protein